MGKNPSTWKQFERDVAAAFGGRRRGADTGGNDGGRTDVADVEQLSVQCKLHGQIGYELIQGDIDSAMQDAAAGQYPVSVVRKKGDSKARTLVCMRIGDFCKMTGLPGPA